MDKLNLIDEPIEIDDDEIGSDVVPNSQQQKIWQLDKRWSLFMNPRTQGLCFNPWQFLKVDVFNKTNVCCTYFGRLPKFEFVSAKEFHKESQMWNHPFMQHMRANNGKQDEVPYCGFCQGRYRNDLPGRTARRLSIIDSQKLYQDKLDEVAEFKYKGIINTLDEDLSKWSFKLERKNGYEWFPFKSYRQFYRRDIRLAKFQNIGHIALLGSSLSPYSAFLLEANTELDIICWQRKQMSNVDEFTQALGLEVSSFHQLDQDCVLPYRDNTLSGIWLDAMRWMTRYPINQLFSEILRVLKPDGVLRVVCAPCIGNILINALDTNILDTEIIVLLQQHLNKAAGKQPFFEIETLSRVLKKMGFTLDKERPPQIKVIGEAFREDPKLGRDAHTVVKRIEKDFSINQLRNNPELLEGLDQFISFCARKKPTRTQNILSHPEPDIEKMIFKE